MTFILMGCPGCGRNFMLADTELSKGRCILCSTDASFSEKEISDAEIRRDRLSAEFEEPMKEAFRNGDFKKMEALAEKAAVEGVSSWYVWTLIGQMHLDREDVDNAFRDFELASSFLDEESFDEYYGMVIGPFTDYYFKEIEKKDYRPFDPRSMVFFTGNLDDRFSDIMDDSFLTDFIKRIGYGAGDLSEISCYRCSETIAESCIIFNGGDMYFPDHQETADSSIWALEELERRVKDISGEKSRYCAAVNIYKEFLKAVEEKESAILSVYDGDGLDTLCEILIDDQDLSDRMVNFLFDGLEGCVDYARSFGRNKGAKKIMEKAVGEYGDFLRDLAGSGIVDNYHPDETEEEGDRSRCPSCGEPLQYDSTGFALCGCGFRTRKATEKINDLPGDLDSLSDLLREALEKEDSETLNNIGELILDSYEDHPLGYLGIGASCSLDGDLSASAQMFSGGIANLDDGLRDFFYGTAGKMLGKCIINLQDDKDLISFFVFLRLNSGFGAGGENYQFLDDLCAFIRDGGWPLNGEGTEMTGYLKAMAMADRFRHVSFSGWIRGLRSDRDYFEDFSRHLGESDPEKNEDYIGVFNGYTVFIDSSLEFLEEQTSLLGPQKVKEIEEKQENGGSGMKSCEDLQTSLMPRFGGSPGSRELRAALSDLKKYVRDLEKSVQ